MKQELKPGEKMKYGGNESYTLVFKNIDLAETKPKLRLSQQLKSADSQEQGGQNATEDSEG